MIISKNIKLAVEERAKRFRQMRYISKNIFPLKLIAHNGSRFDLPALQNELFKLVDPSKISAIRKGASFFSLSVDLLTFLDSTHFVPNMKLAKFCKTFNVETPKGISYISQKTDFVTQVMSYI